MVKLLEFLARHIARHLFRSSHLNTPPGLYWLDYQPLFGECARAPPGEEQTPELERAAEIEPRFLQQMAESTSFPGVKAIC